MQSIFPRQNGMEYENGNRCSIIAYFTSHYWESFLTKYIFQERSVGDSTKVTHNVPSSGRCTSKLRIIKEIDIPINNFKLFANSYELPLKRSQGFYPKFLCD